MAPRHFRGRGTKRLTQWIASAINTDHTALAAATKLLDQSFGLSGETRTIVRTRGLFTFASDQNAADETPFGAFGITIVSPDAIAAGAASVPGPYASPEWEGWFVHQFFAGITKVASAIGFNTMAPQYEINSKAMRKLDASSEIVVVVENASATDGLIFTMDFRMLLKES